MITCHSTLYMPLVKNKRIHSFLIHAHSAVAMTQTVPAFVGEQYKDSSGIAY